ncbi:MAG: hypothetical protein QHJ73_03910, partial [Armatimonadota bacterium]|nr:hypothetical protein [Armatimonadota bacterium]
NRVVQSGKVGILFRQDGPDRMAPHRCVVEENVLQGGGTPEAPAVGIQIEGAPESLVIRDNQIINPDGGHLLTGIRVGPRVPEVRLEGNQFAGVPNPIEDLRRTTS